MLTATKSKRPFATDEARWHAVQRRDPAADGAFYSAVKTTGVYCRPVCPARTPLRKNIAFYDTTSAAERAGFRPCKRCRPQEASLSERHAALVARVCRLIEEADENPNLQSLAEAVGTSPYHLHRLFKAQTGLTPKQYAAARRAERVRGELTEGSTVTQAIYGAGYGSNSRFYESSTEMLGMTPTAYRAGGRGTTIRFAISRCWLGHLLVASTEKGICSIMLDDDPAFLHRQLENRFPHAELVDGKKDFKALVAQVVAFVSDPSRGLNLPLDIRGTAFQQQVWQALRKIPAGTTVTYTDIAKRIGHPESVRAVANAVGANPVAVAIPCHRVIHKDGSISGYRWGVDRKQKLIERERKTK